MQSEKVKFARRHLYGLAAIGAAAVIARAMRPTPAQAHFVEKGCQPDPTNCFLEGTQVITAQGALPIEEVVPGDEVLTLHGLKPVQKVLRFPSSITPVCITRSALDVERPCADLYLSPGHAIEVDGALVTAGSLINGRSIRYADEIFAPEYLHLQFAGHELIYAHGVACESYVAGRAADMVLDASGTRRQIASHLRSALSPWIEVRQPVDILRDRLAGL